MLHGGIVRGFRSSARPLVGCGVLGGRLIFGVVYWFVRIRAAVFASLRQQLLGDKWQQVSSLTYEGVVHGLKLMACNVRFAAWNQAYVPQIRKANIAQTSFQDMVNWVSAPHVGHVVTLPQPLLPTDGCFRLRCCLG
jgi:hypothetical protein